MDEAETYLRAGQFGAGSMQPKVAAAVQFVRSGWRRRAVIASLEQAPAAMRGESGTPVSYTHLDVYTRQTGLSAMRMAFISVMMRHTSLNCSTSLRSFSSEKSTP